MDRKCEACEFFEAANKEWLDGWCHRCPPSWYTYGNAEDIDASCGFATTSKSEWCGEFKPREGK